MWRTVLALLLFVCCLFLHACDWITPSMLYNNTNVPITILEGHWVGKEGHQTYGHNTVCTVNPGEWSKKFVVGYGYGEILILDESTYTLYGYDLLNTFSRSSALRYALNAPRIWLQYEENGTLLLRQGWNPPSPADPPVESLKPQNPVDVMRGAQDLYRRQSLPDDEGKSR